MLFREYINDNSEFKKEISELLEGKNYRILEYFLISGNLSIGELLNDPDSYLIIHNEKIIDLILENMDQNQVNRILNNFLQYTNILNSCTDTINNIKKLIIKGAVVEVKYWCNVPNDIFIEFYSEHIWLLLDDEKYRLLKKSDNTKLSWLVNNNFLNFIKEEQLMKLFFNPRNLFLMKTIIDNHKIIKEELPIFALYFSLKSMMANIHLTYIYQLFNIMDSHNLIFKEEYLLLMHLTSLYQKSESIYNYRITNRSLWKINNEIFESIPYKTEIIQLLKLHNWENFEVKFIFDFITEIIQLIPPIIEYLDNLGLRKIDNSKELQ